VCPLLFWPHKSDALTQPSNGEIPNELTKSIVATSLAVVKCGTPAFGLGTLATTSRPFSIDMRNALLNMPSGYFLIETHRSAPTDSAAILASLFMSNLICRFRRFSASSTIKRPRVNLKNSSLEFQSDTDELYVKSSLGRHDYLPEKSPGWRDSGRRIECELSRLSDSVALGLVFYFERRTRNGRIGIGTS
jgi:hypothetical protein